MQAGDYGESRSEPWTYRARIMPLRTYSGRVVYRRHKHTFMAKDAARILAKIQPAPNDDGEDWAHKVIAMLRAATIAMLERILYFLPDGLIEELYEWCIEMLDKLFSKFSFDIPGEPSKRKVTGRRAIMEIASLAGLSVKISE